MEKICPKTGKKFEITQEELELLDKVSPIINGKKFALQEPKYHPEWRQLLRVAFRNERALYKRECDLTDRPIIANYPSDSLYKVYSQEAFWSDDWNALDYGQKYDSNRPFFEQFQELMAKVPRLSLINKQSQNSEYCNYSFANKNCYLIFGGHYEEDCLYGGYSTKNRNCMDYFFLYNSELCYECSFSGNCYNCVQLERCLDCRDCLFSYDLRGCKDCLFSHNLRNKQYYIFNQQKTKEEYEEYLESLKLSHREQFQKIHKGWLKYRSENAIFKAMYQTNTENCEGNNHQNSKNLKVCFSCTECEDCVHGYQMDKTYSSVDNSHTGYDRCELCYQTVGHNGAFHCLCCDSCWHSSDLIYCNLCFSCKDCFGCIGLQQKQYCILNTQYTKEEYFQIVEQIMRKMIIDGTWGDFFPIEVYPFAYNESVANDWYPMTKKQALENGFRWRDDLDDSLKADQRIVVPNEIKDLPDEILKQALTCEESGRPYKIVKKELDFYRQLELPIPQFCPGVRNQKRMKLAPPYQIFKRSCTKCQKDIRSVWPESRPEKNIYCEDCYLDLVY